MRVCFGSRPRHHAHHLAAGVHAVDFAADVGRWQRQRGRRRLAGLPDERQRTGQCQCDPAHETRVIDGRGAGVVAADAAQDRNRSIRLAGIGAEPFRGVLTGVGRDGQVIEPHGVTVAITPVRLVSRERAQVNRIWVENEAVGYGHVPVSRANLAPADNLARVVDAQGAPRRPRLEGACTLLDHWALWPPIPP